MPTNPFQYLRPVPASAFVGRWPLVREIAENLLIEGGESHAAVAGRRCGKSSLLLALAYQLRQPGTADNADYLPLPILFDFKSSSLTSEGGCLAEILDTVRRHVDVAVRRRPPDAWPNPIPLEEGWFKELCQAKALSLRDFGDAVGYILDQLSAPLQPVRLVLLLDEMDELLGFNWTDALFNQLRALVYSSDIKSQVRLVLTGSRRFLDEVSTRGSPLWNVMMFHYLGALDEASIRQLAERAQTVAPGGLPEPIVSAIWAQSGGQPFLAQFLLYHLCQGEDGPATDAGTLPRLVERFLHERIADLEGWARAMEPAGLLAYRVLASAPDWLEERQIVRQVNNPKINIKRGLTALCYHGVAAHDGSWQRYRRTGDLFKAWYEAHAAAFLAEAATPAVPGSIHAETVIISSNTQVQIGDDVEGDKVGGDKITTGDIQNSQGVAIGRDASAEVK